MLENMTKEELIEEVKRLRALEIGFLHSELYHLKMVKQMNIPAGTPRPDGYAYGALPEDRSGQIPSLQDLDELKTSGAWLGSSHGVGYRTNNPHSTPESTEGVSKEEVAEVFSTAKEKINAAVEKIVAYQKEAAEEDKKEYSGWCLRITDFEGIKFLYLKNPEGISYSIPVDSRKEVNGVQNNPQVLTQFANVLGTRDIVGVWPRWWKMEKNEDSFIISRGGMSYTITTSFPELTEFVENFFKHLNTVRVQSIDEADGA